MDKFFKNIKVESCLKFDVVILGGGFAGVYCAKSLEKSFGKGSEKKIAIIADQNYMLFQPMLPEVVGSSLPGQHIVNPIRRICRKSRVLKAHVKSIDFKSRKVIISAGVFTPDIEVRYEHLVIAMGCVVDLSRVPGMPEHAYLMQNMGDALHLRSTIVSRIEEANLIQESALRKRLLTFVVVGGGYSGVETAGQILGLLKSACKYYIGIKPDDFRVVLVHSRDYLLPTMSKDLGKYAEVQLRKHGMEIFLNARVRAVTSHKVYLGDDQFIESNTIISTVGNAPNPVVSNLCVNENLETRQGRILTNSYMQVKGYKNVWAAGDCAAVPIKGLEEYAFPTAQFAMRQGILLGKNIANQMEEEELKPFCFKGLGELAVIGHRTAVANIMGLKFSGFFAWWLWRSIYLMKLPGLDRKVRVLISWTLDLFFPRDLSLVNPKFTKALNEVYLEPEDILFNRGENAFSFYVVEKGKIDLVDEDGNIIRTITAGDFFGERALMNDKIYRYTAIARESTVLISLGSDEFRKLLEGSSAFKKILMRSLKKDISKDEMDNFIKRLPSELVNMKTSQVMNAEVLCAHSDMILKDAMDLFEKEKHSFYPFIDNKTKALKGMISRNDFYYYIQNHDMSVEVPLEFVGLSKAYKVNGDMKVPDLVRYIIRAGIPKVVVVDKDEKVLGIVSIFDVLHSSRKSKISSQHSI